MNNRISSNLEGIIVLNDILVENRASTKEIGSNRIKSKNSSNQKSMKINMINKSIRMGKNSMMKTKMKE